MIGHASHVALVPEDAGNVDTPPLEGKGDTIGVRYRGSTRSIKIRCSQSESQPARAFVPYVTRAAQHIASIEMQHSHYCHGFIKQNGYNITSNWRPTTRPFSTIGGLLVGFMTAVGDPSACSSCVAARLSLPVRIRPPLLDSEFGTTAALLTILLVASEMAVFLVFGISAKKKGAFV